MKDNCFLVEPAVNVSVVYAHVPNDPQHAIWAYNLIEGWKKHPPEYHCKLVLASAVSPPSDQMIGMFRTIIEPHIFLHDDKGWDIGAYQAYSQNATEDLLVFLGGSTYLRRAGWLARMVEAFIKYEGKALFGSCGNTGDSRFNVYPHIRTTGFWCTPYVMNNCPMRVGHPDQRYPFEHGITGLTSWAMCNSIPVKVADFSGEYDYPAWNDGPNGYHRGDQRDLLVGDRLTAPPYYPHP